MAVLTKEGLRKLQEELDDLQTNQRAEVVQEIEIAKGFGDLSENAEYSAAREKQSRIEGRILELQEMIEHAEVIDVDNQGSDAAMLRACAKRPVSYESLERAVSSIEQTLMSTYDREVTSVRIGELTMQELKKIDEVAYVRFASVYQQFADVESFFNELKKLMGDRKK